MFVFAVGILIRGMRECVTVEDELKRCLEVAVVVVITVETF